MAVLVAPVVALIKRLFLQVLLPIILALHRLWEALAYALCLMFVVQGLHYLVRVRGLARWGLARWRVWCGVVWCGVVVVPVGYATGSLRRRPTRRANPPPPHD